MSVKRNDPVLMANKGRIAKLHYLANNFRVLVPGDHVMCAVSGVPIPLDSLRYWSIVRQEAYLSAEEATKAEQKG